MESRKKFLDKMNQAFADCDTAFLAKNVTDDIKWKIVGEKTISGKDQFKVSLSRMKLGGPLEIEIVDTFMDDHKAVVEGIVKMKEEPGRKRKYAFCDIYIFQSTEDNKVKELRTYVSQIKND